MTNYLFKGRPPSHLPYLAYREEADLDHPIRTNSEERAMILSESLLYGVTMAYNERLDVTQTVEDFMNYYYPLEDV